VIPLEKKETKEVKEQKKNENEEKLKFSQGI
jgi:hypothetical protein